MFWGLFYILIQKLKGIVAFRTSVLSNRLVKPGIWQKNFYKRDNFFFFNVSISESVYFDSNYLLVTYGVNIFF